jgi:hypothetical protein
MYMVRIKRNVVAKNMIAVRGAVVLVMVPVTTVEPRINSLLSVSTTLSTIN